MKDRKDDGIHSALRILRRLLHPGAEWCNQCYARVGAIQSRPAGSTDGTPAPAGRLGWTPAAPEHLPVYSSLRAGPTSFGVVGRIVLSVGLLILVVVGYFVIVGNIGVGLGWQSFGIYLLTSPVVVVPLMFRIWRPARIH